MNKVSVGAVCLLGLTLFLASGFSVGHSASYNYPWLDQYISTYLSGALFPRHLPGLWSGLGGYDFFFYGPLPFWVMATFISPLCGGCEISTTIMLGTALFWSMSGFTAYLFLRRYFASGAAVYGAIAYTILPYHILIDWYVRQALGEFAAYAFIPLIAYGIDAIRLGGRGKWVLTLGAAGTVLCHLPTALLAAHVAALVVLVFAIIKLLKHEAFGVFLFEVTLWGGLGLLLTCFYWLPAVVLVEHVANDLLYTKHFIATRWLFELSGGQVVPEFGQTILWSFLTVIPFTLLALAYSKSYVRLWILLPTALVVFLNTNLSAMIWENWIIQKVQFPWRLMVFVDFSAAIAVAVLAARFETVQRSVLVLCIVLASLPTFKVIQASEYWISTPYDTSSPQPGASEYLSPEMVRSLKAELGYDNEEMRKRMPVNAQMQAFADEISQANEGRVVIEVGHRRAEIKLLEYAETVVVPIQFWEFWEARTADGQELTVAAHDTFGVLTVDSSLFGLKGQQIILSLPHHWSEQIGLAISTGSLILWLLVVFLSRRRPRLIHN